MTLPYLPPFIDMLYNDKDGKLTPNALLYNDEMNNTLRVLLEQFNELVITSFASNDFVNTGVKVSQATTAQITSYGADTNVPHGTIWFDTDVSKLKVKTGAGVIETITSA